MSVCVDLYFCLDFFFFFFIGQDCSKLKTLKTIFCNYDLLCHNVVITRFRSCNYDKTHNCEIIYEMSLGEAVAADLGTLYTKVLSARERRSKII